MAEEFYDAVAEKRSRGFVGVLAAAFCSLIVAARERAGHTLQPTALVHEACVHLLGREALPGENRGRFLAFVAQAQCEAVLSEQRCAQSRPIVLSRKRWPPTGRQAGRTLSHVWNCRMVGNFAEW